MVFNRIILISLLAIFSLLGQTEELTNSQRWSKFNTDSAERLSWILSQHKKVNNRLKLSPNFKILEKTYRNIFDFAKMIQSETLPDGKVFNLIDRGLGKPQELKMITDEKEEIIFSTASLSRKNTFNILRFVINNSATKAALIFDYKGATDGFTFLVLDLVNKNPQLNNKMVSYNGSEESLFFKDDLTLVAAEDESEGTWGIKAYPLDSTIAPYYLYEKVEMKNRVEGWMFLVGENSKPQLVLNEEKIIVENLGDSTFIGVKNNFFYFSKVVDTKTQIVRFAKNSPNKVEVLASLDKNIVATFLLEKFIVLEESWGKRRSLIAYDLLDQSSKAIEVPDFCSVITVNESENEKVLDIVIKSELISAYHLLWNFTDNQLTDFENLKMSMQTSGAVSIETRYIDIKSFDGTFIPIKLVYQKGTELLNMPVFIESYGGFNIDGYLHPNFNFFNLDFVKHGGLYIGTGLRGGSEYAEKWHQAGALNNKMKTYEDLASVAKWLIDQGISSKEKIVSSGSSNGGLTVAATGLLYPQYFGLVISHNGVLDMLGKEVLDPSFNYGWSDEYGDSRLKENLDYIKSFSPLEHVKNLSSGTHFLIINGRNDTRVNPAHSIKFSLAAAAIANSQVELVSLNNSGHFNTSTRYDDYIGWRADVIKWTTIYDFLNIQY